jgi:hypothetical protein
MTRKGALGSLDEQLIVTEEGENLAEMLAVLL